MMTAAAFLATTPHPTEGQVVDAMSRNYCRCGCYNRIKRAVLIAAEQQA
jgi:aerobic-type carbon monoxide dehydrogenase small subunit (CoxS/CutS family)